MSVVLSNWNRSWILPEARPQFCWLKGNRLLAFNLAVALAYYACARFGLQLQFAQSQATPVWPPTGIAIAIGFLVGYRVLPGIALGAFFANLVDFHMKTAGSWSALLTQHPEMIAGSTLIATGNCAEAYLASTLLRRRVGDDYFSNSLRGVLDFLWIVIVACAVSASVGVASLVALELLPPAIAPAVWMTWWVGDAVGAAIVTPLLVWVALYAGDVARDLRSTRALTALGLSILAGGMTFLSWGHVAFLTSEAYLLMPLLMFITLTFGRTLSLLSIAIVSAMAIWGTVHNTGPFVRPDSNISLVLLQGFVGVVVISTMLLDAMHRERQKAVDALTRLNLDLEGLVADRTLQLEKSNRELARSNKELDDFAYIASHDLKEPLRGVENQLAFLVEDYGRQLSPEVMERLDRVPPILRHLEGLIGTLLHYSRVGRVDLAIMDVALDPTVDDVVASLAGRIQEQKVEIRRPAPLPVVSCDSARIGELFRNLITNAIKYNDKAERWIEIGCDSSRNPPVFHVRDNGIGIREQHIDRIFQIFKRLHAPDKFGGGTGAGMTICKKIVERHGGRIWVQSKLGEGTTFNFTLAEDPVETSR
ncbi:MAG TPA: MASE1 domain-containing protein [Solimonas sp.]|nr:MASE1 domain-containing protein [Solimonas sp.]